MSSRNVPSFKSSGKAISQLHTSITVLDVVVRKLAGISLVLLVGVCFAAVGCGQKRAPEPAYLMKSRHQLDKVVSRSYIEESERDHMKFVESILRNVRMRLDDPEELRAYVSKMETRYTNAFLISDSRWPVFTNSVGIHEPLYFFSYSDEDTGYDDYGVLATDGDRIRVRWIWGASGGVDPVGNDLFVSPSTSQ